MNAAETSASSAMADCTPLAVVSRSLTTAEIDTFIRDVSTTRTNIAAASRSATRWSTGAALSAPLPVGSLTLRVRLDLGPCLLESIHELRLLLHGQRRPDDGRLVGEQRRLDAVGSAAAHEGEHGRRAGGQGRRD